MKIVKNMCRICLGSNNLSNIFVCDSKPYSLSQKIMYCASVQIAEDDSLPSKICKQCNSYLEIAFVFKTLCEATDLKLRNLYKNDNHSNIELEENAEKRINCMIDTDDNSSIFQPLSVSVKCLPEKCISPNNPAASNNLLLDANNSELNECFVIEHQVDENTSSENSVDMEQFLIVKEKENFDENIGFSKQGLTIEEDLPILEEVCIETHTTDKNYINTYTESSIETFDNIDDKNDKISIKTIEESNKSQECNGIEKHKTERVGRHIAKKNAGQHPRKVQQVNSTHTDKNNENQYEEQKNCKEEKQSSINNLDNTLFHEHMFEDDIFSPMFEETVVTEGAEDVINEDFVVEEEEEKIIEIERPKLIQRRKGNRIKRKNKKTYKKIDDFKIKLKNRRLYLKKLNTKIIVNKEEEEEVDDLGFTCNVCSKTFPYKSHLIRHLNTHTGIKKYNCEYCNKKFSNNYNLSVHLRKHTGNFPLKCNICNKGISSPSLLKRHLRTHTGETPFQCKYCSKRFGQSSSLQCHEKMHIHRPSYTCDICFKIFSYSNSLAAHKKTHLGFKAFSCNVCYKSFTRNTSLKRHMVCHIDDKKIECKFCSKSFTSNSNFTSHLKIHDKYKCEACGLILNNNKAVISYHIKKHRKNLQAHV